MPTYPWLLVLAGALLQPSPPARPQVHPAPTDTTLAALERLVGRWGPGGANTGRRVIHEYTWAVGRMALHLREGFPIDHPDQAELDGLVFWHPAAQLVQFVAVAGRRRGQGRVFEGEYRVLADSTIERIYDVYYRSLADTPGEELGGNRRRYREIYRWVTADSVEARLDWWRDGGWQPYGPGTYAMVRLRAM
jgi:hypothetical protein